MKKLIVKANKNYKFYGCNLVLPKKVIILKKDIFGFGEYLTDENAHHYETKAILIDSDCFTGRGTLKNVSSVYGVLSKIEFKYTLGEPVTKITGLNIGLVDHVDYEFETADFNVVHKKVRNFDEANEQLKELNKLIWTCEAEKEYIQSRLEGIESYKKIFGGKTTSVPSKPNELKKYETVCEVEEIFYELMTHVELSPTSVRLLTEHNSITFCFRYTTFQVKRDLEKITPIYNALYEKECEENKPITTEYEENKHVTTEAKTLDYSNSDDVKYFVMNNPYPKYIKEKVKVILKDNSSEGQRYMRSLLTLPYWNEKRCARTTEEVRSILDAKHYGMDEVKDKISDYISLLNLNIKNVKPPILCLVGGAGTGKTTIAYAIAEALGRDFVKMSVGGIDDSLSIKGFESSYTNSSAGMVIRAMQQSSSINPVFLIDEIDKMSPVHGDPVGALLEVLDPTQNNTFIDTYLSVPYDFSKVLFITTANDINNIPTPLRSRLEIIDIPSYTDSEKVTIAKQYMLKKEQTRYEIEDINIELDDQDIEYMIQAYTNEAGVRELERCISRIVMKTTIAYKNTDEKHVKITHEILEKWIGKPKYKRSTTKLEEKSEVGVCNSILYADDKHRQIIKPIEVLPVDNARGFHMDAIGCRTEIPYISTTLRYLEENSKNFDIENILQNKGFHFHMQGWNNIISDNGIASSVLIATISALTKIPLSNSIATVGEISLHGQLIKTIAMDEKLKIASNSGIKKIYIPRDGSNVTTDTNSYKYGDMEVVLVDNASELVDLVFGDKISKNIEFTNEEKRLLS